MAPVMHSSLTLNFTPNLTQQLTHCGEWQVMGAGLGGEFVLPLSHCF